VVLNEFVYLSKLKIKVMDEKELLEMYISDVELLKNNLDEGYIDVYQFYEEILSLNEFFKAQLK
jgi:hypothetical protein